MALEAIPLEYTRCFRCKAPATKKAVYLGAYRLMCEKHLKEVAEELNTEVKVVVVKYDEPVLNLPPVVSRQPEHEGANCWNFRDPEVQKAVERKRTKQERENTEKFDEVLQNLKGVANLLYELDGASETIVKDGIEFLIVGDWACRKQDDGKLMPVYTFKDRKFGYIKLDEFKIEFAEE